MPFADAGMPGDRHLTADIEQRVLNIRKAFSAAFGKVVQQNGTDERVEFIDIPHRFDIDRVLINPRTINKPVVHHRRFGCKS